jgi:hypothetical protein
VTEAEKEQAKNKASWLNSMSTAVATAGAIGPVFTFVFDVTPKVNIWALIGIAFVCAVVAWIIHEVGQEIVGAIQ